MTPLLLYDLPNMESISNMLELLVHTTQPNPRPPVTAADTINGASGKSRPDRNGDISGMGGMWGVLSWHPAVGRYPNFDRLI